MIQIKNIVKDYKTYDTTVHALKKVNINFRNSEFVSILGPSGCGKTTLLNIIGGLDKYTSGDIIINGVSTKEYKDKDWDAYRNHYIGFVFQSYNLINNLSILENVELALTIAGLSKKQKKNKALKALREVGLEKHIKKKPNQLSGGQMQRVAIARAIVNEPKIILADEPTGALDSETSVQIMDLLKKISDKYLIIMVTHNEKLAKDYSTRIISILDGEITGDTNTYNPSKEEIDLDKDEYLKISDKEKKVKTKKKIKSAMGYGTSFSLSLKNLWSKRGKTFMECFAGSIGIIGIALVLAVSAGFNGYIENLQTNTLGGYPLTLSMISIDMDSLKANDIGGMLNNGEEVSNNDSFGVYDQLGMFTKLGHLNLFNDDFNKYLLDYVENDKDKRQPDIKTIQFDYNLPIKVITKNYNLFTNDGATNVLSGTSKAQIYEIIDNKDWVLENYDVVAGNYAKNEDELMLVLGSDNKVDISFVQNFGLDVVKNSDGSYQNIKYEDVINNSNYALVFNNAYYKFDGSNYSINDFTNLNQNKILFDNAMPLNEFNVNSNNGLLKMKISGVLKPKENADIEILKTGLAYLPKLREFYNNVENNSNIVKFTKNAIQSNIDNGINDDLKYKINLPWKYKVTIAEMAMIGLPPEFLFNSTDGIVEYVKTKLNKDISYETAYNISLQAAGVTNVPFSIMFYPTSFDAKENIINYISAWNKSELGASNKIIYTDSTAMLTNSMGQMVDIISYVLIAFAGISLIVSSVMIGIITYTSVIERTKEIGILRSIGARKKDISRIFNSETLLIGFFAGLLGVFISWILTFPISAIIKSVAGGAITTSMAILRFGDASILVLISTILTSIAGTIPASIASKKDPVTCLRSE